MKIGRYIRVQCTNPSPVIDGCVNIDAILAFSRGTALTFTDGEVSPPIDENSAWYHTKTVDGTLAHSSGLSPNDFVQLNFDQPSPVDCVVVVNRFDAPWRDRMQNATLILLDANMEEVWRKDFGSSTELVYVFFPSLFRSRLPINVLGMESVTDTHRCIASPTKTAGPGACMTVASNRLGFHFRILNEKLDGSVSMKI